MPRDWADEPFVKLYTRTNPDWDAMPWQARALLLLALKSKFDRAGYLDLGRRGVDGIGSIVGLPDEVASAGLRYLLEIDKCWRLVPRDGRMWICWPNYYPAQMAAASANVRKAMQRERDRAIALAEGLQPDQAREVLNGGQESLPLVTAEGHASKSRVERHDQNRLEDQTDLAPGAASGTSAREGGKVPTLSGQLQAKAHFDALRGKKTDASDESFGPREVNAMLKGPLLEFGLPALKRMAADYLASDRYATKTPPWPFRLFVKVHRQHHKAEAQIAKSPPSAAVDPNWDPYRPKKTPDGTDR